MEGAASAMAEALEWINGFVMRPNPDLGRRGDVCPFMVQSMSHGRVSMSVVQVSVLGDADKLRSAAREGIDRIEASLKRFQQHSAALFVPVGDDPQIVLSVTRQVQQELREEAMRRGCMIGDFSPGNDTPGARNPQFRPLDSPVAILGVRGMVDTDLIFLGHPAMSAAERRQGLDQWMAHFGRRASRSLLEACERLRAELPPIPDGAPVGT